MLIVVERVLSRIGNTKYEGLAIGFIIAVKFVRLKDEIAQFAFVRMRGQLHAGKAVRNGDQKI